MPIEISSAHPTFALKEKIQALSQTFLKQQGFSYFQYLRCFSDGSVSLLTNNTGLVEYFQTIDNQPLVFSHFSEAYHNTPSYWFLWDEVLPEMPVTLAREKFHMHNGLTLVRRAKHYYDMIAVALPYEQENAGSFYLNKLKAIEQFIHQFDKDNKGLIEFISKNPIALPAPYRDKNYQRICLSTGRIEVVGKAGITYITAQEWACLQLLSQGISYKEAAQRLNISPRTIETYGLRMRERTGLSSYRDLEQKILPSTL